MSGFLSRKYLQYRGLLNEAEPRSIEEDLPCTGCGYNLRGLNYGRNCPECGQMIGRRPAGATTDPLLMGDESGRTVLSVALLAGALCLWGVVVARFFLLTGQAFRFGITSPTHYIVLGFVLGALWIVTCLVVIRAVPKRSPKWNMAARIAAWSQVLWLPGYVLFAMRVNATLAAAPNEHVLHIANLLVRGAAGTGALAVAWFMMCTAEDAELEDTASRINLAVWLLPILTIWNALLPTQVHWMIAIFLLALPLAWMWFVFQIGRSLWEMHRHIAWNARLAVENVGRMQRIDERRQEMEREVEGRIRPVGRERPVMYEGDRLCKYCHYNLRGLKVSNVCPECGRSIAAVD